MFIDKKVSFTWEASLTFQQAPLFQAYASSDYLLTLSDQWHGTFHARSDDWHKSVVEVIEALEQERLFFCFPPATCPAIILTNRLVKFPERNKEERSQQQRLLPVQI